MKNCYSLFFTWILSLRIMWLNKEGMTQKKGKREKAKTRYLPHIHAQWLGIRPDETLSLAPKWTEQDNVLREMKQAQENKHWVFCIIFEAKKILISEY